MDPHSHTEDTALEEEIREANRIDGNRLSGLDEALQRQDRVVDKIVTDADAARRKLALLRVVLMRMQRSAAPGDSRFSTLLQVMEL